MPVLSQDGKACCGVGSFVVSIDGAIPAALGAIKGGGGHWLNNDLLIFQDDTTVPVLKTYRVSTTGVAQVSALGGAPIAAGGDVWAAALVPGYTRVSSGQQYPGSTLGDVSEVGELLLVVDQQQDRGLRAYDRNGNLQIDLSVSMGPGPKFIRRGVISYFDAVLGPQLYRVGTRQFIPFIRRSGLYWFVPVPMRDGSIWLLEGDTAVGNRLSLRRWDAATGYTLVVGSDTFNADAIELSPGLVRVAWSQTAGEAPGDLFVADVDVATGQWILGHPQSGTTTSGALTGGTLPSAVSSNVSSGDRVGMRKVGASPLAMVGGNLEGAVVTDPAGRPTAVPYPTTGDPSTFFLAANRTFVQGLTAAQVAGLLAGKQDALIYDAILGAYIKPRP